VVPTVLEGEGASPFAVVVAGEHGPSGSDSNDGASDVAGRLRRIADQIEAAGVLAPLFQASDALGLPVTSELSPRQWAILSRLVRGEPVATIAAEMYLSRSTIRNHLSAIFQKVGVHSQQELLALWRSGTRSRPLYEV